MPIIVVILGVIIIVLGAAFFLLPTPKQDPTITPVITEDSKRTEVMEANEEQTVVAESPEPTPTAAPVTAREQVTYLTPARTEHKLDVSLTIEAGIVTDAVVVYDEKQGFSNQHQERFDNAYRSEVIGKPLTDISLARVGGASLTSQAFNEAVKKVLELQVR